MRFALAAACLLFVLVQGVQTWSTYNFYGMLPPGLNYTAQPTGDAYVSRVVTPSRDGRIELGDTIDWRLASANDRFRMATRWVSGSAFTIPIVRHGRVLRVPFIAAHDEMMERPRAATIALWVGIVGNLWIVAFALLLSVRASQTLPARLLIAILLAELSWIGQAGTFVTPWLWLDVSMAALGVLGYVASIVLIAVYAATFARPLSSLRKAFFAAAVASALIAAVLLGLDAFAAFGTTLDLTSEPLVFSWLTDAIPVGAAVLTLVAALAASRGLERNRLLWATASLGILFVPTAIVSIVSAYVPSFDMSAGIIANVASFLTPVGLSYVLLNRRLLDVGFSLSRATVFAVLSLIVFGAFNLAEWALGGWLSSLNRTADAGLSASIAIALGFSLKPLHDGVERVVDRVFFRKRYETEKALLAITRQAPHFRDSAALLREFERVLAEHVDAPSTMLEADIHGRFGDLDPNDGALVALRTKNEVVDLHGVRTALRGEHAFPMIVRGELIGVVVLGSKPYGEPYAPDESSAIERAANAVGLAIDGFSHRVDEELRSVLATVNSLNAELADLAKEMRALRRDLASFQNAREERSGLRLNP